MYTNNNFYTENSSILTHVAIIPDGGRRWAKKHNISYKESYTYSVKKIMCLLERLYDYGVPYVSVFFASTQNFLRNEFEIESFCDVQWEGIVNKLLPFAQEYDIQIKIVGKHDEIYSRFADKISYVESQTFSKKKRKLFLCFNYNSLDEIEMAFEIRKDQEPSFVNYLKIPYPVDILIRTGGAQTLSGFLLPQLAFARLFFLDELFNDITISKLNEILTIYGNYTLKHGQ